MSEGVASVIPPPAPSPRPAEAPASASPLLAARQNPILLRELRQIARLKRTPLLLATLTAFAALLTAAVGGLASSMTEPARVGFVLFQSYFSLAYAFVTWVGPALAASSIAGERGLKTWEAILLTGLPVERVARGKFLAAFVHLGVYLVMLLPVGGLTLLFGGVTELELGLAFLILLALSALAVAFGLAVSSLFSSVAPALLLTLLLGIPLSFFGYAGLGFGLSMAAHELWPGVAQGAPVWLPTAYVRADFGVDYVLFLVAAPLVLGAIAGSFLYELTLRNLSAPSADRSTRIRLWYVAAVFGLSSLAVATCLALGEVRYAVFSICILGAFFCAASFLFAGEPLAPSRRVVVSWESEQRSRLWRFFGPGLIRAHVLLACTEWLFLAVLGGVGLSLATTTEERTGVAIVTIYVLGFLHLLVGLGSFVRAHAQHSTMPRVSLFATCFTLSVGPWLVVSLLGMWRRPETLAWVTVPSPTYIVTVLEALRNQSSDNNTLILAALIDAAANTLVGALLFSLGSVEARRRTQKPSAALTPARAPEQYDPAAAP